MRSPKSPDALRLGMRQQTHRYADAGALDEVPEAAGQILMLLAWRIRGGVRKPAEGLPPYTDRHAAVPAALPRYTGPRTAAFYGSEGTKQFSRWSRARLRLPGSPAITRTICRRAAATCSTALSLSYNQRSHRTKQTTAPHWPGQRRLVSEH